MGKPRKESPKRIISTSSGLGRLKMVSELDTGRCASKDVGPPEGGLRDPTWVRKGNETISTSGDLCPLKYTLFH